MPGKPLVRKPCEQLCCRRSRARVAVRPLLRRASDSSGPNGHSRATVLAGKLLPGLRVNVFSAE